jgi:aryl-alcohol dehydrogenase
MRATAAITQSKGAPFELREVDIEEPRSNDVLIRIVASGICHTDLIVRDQWYPPELPAVLGHEGAGVVERVGPEVTLVEPGDKVVISFAFCRQCRHCLSGRVAYCDNFIPRNFGGRRADGSTPIRLDGREINANFFGQSSFSTYSIAAEHALVKVPEDVPLELVAPLGCGIQTGAGAVLNTLNAAAGSSIAVFGTGAVGLSAIMAANVANCAVIIAVDVQPQRLQLARELGATHTVNGKDPDVVNQIMDITSGGADYTIETTAIPAVLRNAVGSLYAGTGVCGLIGAAAMGTEVSLDMSHLLWGRSVRGIIEGDSVPHLFIPRLIGLYQRGVFPLDRLIKTYPFESISRAVEDSERGVTIKPVLTMETVSYSKER